MVFPPGVKLAALMAERSVTTPGPGLRTSAKLLTLNTAGARRSSRCSIPRRARQGRPFRELLWSRRRALAIQYLIRLLMNQLLLDKGLTMWTDTARAASVTALYSSAGWRQGE